MKDFSIFVVALVIVSGCKTPEETLVGKPPEDEALEANRPTTSRSEKEDERPEYPEPGLVIPSWPYVDERKTFELTWQGGNRPVPLHREPDPNSALLGDVVWENGEPIDWRGTVVAVYAPKVVRAKEEWRVEGAPHTTGYITDDEYVSEMLAPGQPLEIWGYAGSGQCYLGVKGKIIEGLCPPPDSFAGSFPGKITAERYQPAQKVWWIQIAGNNLTGWFPVDDRVVVDIVDE